MSRKRTVMKLWAEWQRDGRQRRARSGSFHQTLHLETNTLTHNISLYPLLLITQQALRSYTETINGTEQSSITLMRLSTHAKRQEHFNFQMSPHQKKNTLQAAKDKVSDINNYKHKNGPFFGRGIEIERLCVTSNSSDDTCSLSTLFTALLKTWFWHIAILELTCYIPSAPGGQPYPFPVEN